MNQKDLGQKLNLSKSTISSYEQGRREPDFNTLIQLADYFEVSIDYSLGHSDIRKDICNRGMIQYKNMINDILTLKKESILHLDKYIQFLKYSEK